MNKRIKDLFADRDSSDRDAAYQACVELMDATKKPVAWSYDIWDKLVEDLGHKDGHKRAFSAQMLAHLAISDPEQRILDDFPALAAMLRDNKPVTARHTLQALWRVGLAGPKQRQLVVRELAKRFKECAAEKGGRIARTDTVTALGNLARETGDASIATKAAKLIASERDDKAQKKQRASWKEATGHAIEGS